jgi:hypothetical protein
MDPEQKTPEGASKPAPKERRKTLRDIIEKHPVIVFCAAVVAAFAAGWGSYKAVLEATNQETVIKGSYVLKEELKRQESTPQDSGEAVIRQFISRLNARNFEDAWSLIHREKKARSKAVLPNWEAFGKTYDTMVKHENLKVEPEKSSATEASYWVSFDVRDSVPMGRFFEFQDRKVKEMFDNGLLNRAKTLDIAFNDIASYYSIAEKDRALLEKTVEETHLDALFSPMFVFEAARALNLDKQPRGDVARKREVWRHFILNLTLMPEDTSWKISGGLYPPAAIGIYGIGAKVPSK